MTNFCSSKIFGILCLVTVCSATVENVSTKEDSTLIESPDQKEYERLMKIRDEKVLKQSKIDEEWLKSYTELFLEKAQSRYPDQLANDLDHLSRKYAATSNSIELKTLAKDVFDLRKLTYMFTSSCDDKAFDIYDHLSAKYAEGFNESILKFVKYNRMVHWKSCKKAFWDGQDEKEATYKGDEVEVFKLVNHVLENNPAINQDEQWRIDELKMIEPGVISYVRENLGKKARKLEEIDRLFSKTKEACFSVRDRFRGRNEIANIINNRPDLKQDLDVKSMKWLTAIAVCKLFTDYPGDLERKCHQVFSEQHQQSRRKSCIGKLLRKNQ